MHFKIEGKIFKLNISEVSSSAAIEKYDRSFIWVIIMTGIEITILFYFSDRSSINIFLLYYL
jgi:hypothetical protein